MTPEERHERSVRRFRKGVVVKDEDCYGCVEFKRRAMEVCGIGCPWMAEAMLASFEAEADRLEEEYDELERKYLKLKNELRLALASNHTRNLELDALHYVWCDGGCETGVHRWTEEKITHEIVVAAVRNTRRLVTWWRNREYKKTNDPRPDGFGDVKEVEDAKHFWAGKTQALHQEIEMLRRELGAATRELEVACQREAALARFLEWFRDVETWRHLGWADAHAHVRQKLREVGLIEGM